jgi:hypothetical protein
MNIDKLDKLDKYNRMIVKLNEIKKHITIINLQYKHLQEKICEFETNNLIYLDEFNQIKLNKL